MASVYLSLSSLRGVASTKLLCVPRIGHESALHLGHSILVAILDGEDRLLLEPVDIDENYFGGNASNPHASQNDVKQAVVVGIWIVRPVMYTRR